MAKSKSKLEIEDALASTLAEWMNPENADSDVDSDEEEAPAKASKPAATKKVDNVASAFDDLFNN